MASIQVRTTFNWPQFIIYMAFAAFFGSFLNVVFDVKLWAGLAICATAIMLYERKNIFPEERKIFDPFFGELLFMEAIELNQPFWGGRRVFEPTQTEIEYFIDADEEGPREPQRAFYKKFHENYFELKSIITPLLQQRFESNGSGEIWNEPYLSGVSVPLRDAPDCEWVLYFEHAEPMGHPFYTVRMKGWQPTGEIQNK